jgi:hypothetical protein
MDQSPAPLLQYLQPSLFEVQVVDLSAATLLDDGAVIDLDALSDPDVVPRPQRRRRKRQRRQTEVISKRTYG